MFFFSHLASCQYHLCFYGSVFFIFALCICVFDLNYLKRCQFDLYACGFVFELCVCVFNLDYVDCPMSMPSLIVS